MTWMAFGLIVVSAFTHAWWNLRGKRRHPSVAFFFVADVGIALILLPLLIWNLPTLAELPGQFWLFLIATGLAEAVYYIGLANAYRSGEMSMAYPLIRALPVMLVAGASLMLGRGDRIGSIALMGMTIVALGCLLLPLKQFGDLRRLRWGGVLAFVVLAALGTTGYTLIDDLSLHMIRQAMKDARGGEVAVFAPVLVLSTVIWLGGYVMGHRVERGHLRAVWREARWYAVGTGLVAWVTYGLVLLAMGHVSDVSYVAAFRQLSIPIGALMGIVVLKETSHPPKLVGVGLVFLGLVLVSLG